MQGSLLETKQERGKMKLCLGDSSLPGVTRAYTATQAIATLKSGVVDEVELGSCQWQEEVISWVEKERLSNPNFKVRIIK